MLGAARAPPHPTSLTSNRPGGCRASGGLAAVGQADSRTRMEKESLKPLPPKGDLPWRQEGIHPSRQPFSGLVSAPPLNCPPNLHGHS